MLMGTCPFMIASVLYLTTCGSPSGPCPAGQADEEDDQGQDRGRSVSPLLHLGERGPSWKKMASGRVAAGSAREAGTRSVNPAVNRTEAASPMPGRKRRRTPVRMPGAGLADDDLDGRLEARRPERIRGFLELAGTRRMTSSMARHMIGNSSRATVRMPARSDARRPRASMTIKPKAP